MAYYDYDPQSEKAATYSNGGCFPGFLMIPLAVMLVSALLFTTLSKITATPTNAATVKKGKGGNPAVFVSPYDSYVLTQGLHGFSYGHMAIDIAAGKGAKIYSPIHGQITKLFTDEIGNPTLIIENEIYRVTMLHGLYTVKVGQKVKAGQKVGTESNLGNTTDMQGVSCRNRDCGYHTHLNIFDKRIGENVNPLDLLKP
jgi:murein DD-endopeptidase MepM/ murein hydrolase activator NlpD